MSSSLQSKPAAGSRVGLPVFGNYTNSQASILLEKANPGLRRSTPDSEALASSDEEFDHTRLKSSHSKSSAMAARRTHSLADHQQTNRKPSMAAPGSYSPSASNPTTPATDQNAWPAMSPSSTPWGNTSGYPWTGSIWSQKEPPPRLQEMHAQNGHEGLPFSIPLQPTVKTYRSQSYSVGQLESSSTGSQPPSTSGSIDSNRVRAPPPFQSIQRRTSRPGIMSGGEIGGLGRLHEVDDDEDGEATLDVTQRNVEQAREIERLELENARLRRERTMSSTTSAQLQSQFRNTQIKGAVPEESDQAIDDNEEYSSSMSSFGHRTGLNRRFSEQIAHYPDRQPVSPNTNHLSRWQTAGSRLADIPQSRRHSFADVPTRHGSFGSQDADHPHVFDHNTQGYGSNEDPVYFKLDEQRRLDAEASVQQGLYSTNPYAVPPNMNVYGTPSQKFVIVNFKCCRSDIFYIQEGTGLNVEVGDLVIVDADRGTDLGAVQHVNVSLEEARRFKDYYAEEHYKLLMMFSQQTKNGGVNAVNPNGPTSRPSAVGGMGPQSHGHHDGRADAKAKMVKRHAQAHEIQALKEKEGNEAKAKRVCSSKVVEHGLNMEILDAEFQMDQKKLTFYYFADEYINFNSLVTDLFKIYKTRIWMSAINPASFQTPTSSLGITPAYGAAFTGITGPPGRSGFAGGSTMPNQYDNHHEGMPLRGSIPPAPMYPAYQPQAGADNRMGNGYGSSLGSFNGNMQAPPVDPFSPYPAQPFGMYGHNPSNFGIPRVDERSAVSGSSPRWLQQFQGLSMG